MITDYFMITEKSNRFQVIMITDYDYPISGTTWDPNGQMITTLFFILLHSLLGCYVFYEVNPTKSLI